MANNSEIHQFKGVLVHLFQVFQLIQSLLKFFFKNLNEWGTQIYIWAK